MTDLKNSDAGARASYPACYFDIVLQGMNSLLSSSSLIIRGASS
jgi:hypothetical protein